MSDFDQFARHYDDTLQRGLVLSGEGKTYFSYERIAWLRQRLIQMSLSTPAHVADFGCGTGESITHLTDVLGARTALGLETSREMLQEAQGAFATTPGVTFTSLDEYQPNGDVDLVYCNGVFHHIIPQHRPKSLRLIFNMLRAGGIFAFWENSKWNPATRLVMSRIPFDRDAIPISPNEARKIIREARFEVLDTSYRFIFPKWLKLLRRTEPALSKLPLGTQYQIICRKPK